MKAKRIISSVLALSLAVGVIASPAGQEGLPSLFGIQASAADYSYLTFETRSDGNYDIAGCSAAAVNVVVPASYNGKKVVTIKNNAFVNCTGIKTVVIQDGITSIGNSAFEGCTAMTSITLPNTLNRINEWAFFRCMSLKEVTVKQSSWVYLGDHVFDGCTSLETVSLPVTAYGIGSGVFNGCSSLKAVNVAEGNGTYKSVDGMLMSKDGTELLAVPASAESVTIPEGVTELPSDMLKGFGNLTSLTLPEGLTTIGKCAVYDSRTLKEVTIPKSVTQIGAMAFGYYYDSDTINSRAKVEDFTIYGYWGTASHTYAMKNGFKFVPLDDALYSVSLETDESALLENDSEITISFNDDEQTWFDAVDGRFVLPEELADGDYVMTVSADNFAQREYSVTVKNGAFTADPEVKLYAIGDVNNDKAVNMLDITAIKRHLIKVERLDEYKAICADVNNDDIVNTLDILALKRHLIKVEPLWQPI